MNRIEMERTDRVSVLFLRFKFILGSLVRMGTTKEDKGQLNSERSERKCLMINLNE